ncbi:hypothetical protein Lalb_Chr09g0320911 [Lupinus albus]|uniref:Uncharacterized protein n=1 Tax=Lupinus albus TaxID=3870 RepID=A0A6A4PYY3_LUPAL|nr:hypothetical protein Lalb_Chr09g0320911 [Lupinus albus]
MAGGGAGLFRWLVNFVAEVYAIQAVYQSYSRNLWSHILMIRSCLCQLCLLSGLVDYPDMVDYCMNHIFYVVELG